MNHAFVGQKKNISTVVVLYKKDAKNNTNNTETPTK